MKRTKKDKHFIKKPIYEGGPLALRQFITKNLRYPKEALQEKIEGTVVIRYSINYKGKVVASKIISGLGGGFDVEAKRLVHLLVFTAPRNRGIKALFHKDLQIHFKLPVEQKTTIQYNLTTTPKNVVKEKYIPEKTGYTITVNW